VTRVRLTHPLPNEVEHRYRAYRSFLPSDGASHVVGNSQRRPRAPPSYVMESPAHGVDGTKRAYEMCMLCQGNAKSMEVWECLQTTLSLGLRARIHQMRASGLPSRTASARSVAEPCLFHRTSSGARGVVALIGDPRGIAFANLESPEWIE